MQPIRVDATVTFNPTQIDLARTLQQLKELGGIPVVVDNSTHRSAQIQVRDECARSDILLLSQGGNRGTGFALNQVLRYAAERKAHSIHYLDQDSRLSGGYREVLHGYDLDPPLADFVGAEFAQSSPAQPGALQFGERRFVISSGTWFRVATLLQIGGFDESLFLDLVDHEVCLRLRKHGGSILVDHARVLIHPIGTDGRRILGILVTRHPRWRRRLMWVNSIILTRRYFRHFPTDISRHLGVRLYETVLSALILREPAYLSEAFFGAARGLRVSGRERIGVVANL